MTVTPRYASYADALPTGLAAPVLVTAPPPRPPPPPDYGGPDPPYPPAVGDRGPGPPQLVPSVADYYVARRDGVDHVFVGHPIYSAGGDGGSSGWEGQGQGGGHGGGWSYVEGGAHPALGLGFSVLAQVSTDADFPRMHGCSDAAPYAWNATLACLIRFCRLQTVSGFRLLHRSSHSCVETDPNGGRAFARRLRLLRPACSGQTAAAGCRRCVPRTPPGLRPAGRSWTASQPPSCHSCWRRPSRSVAPARHHGCMPSRLQAPAAAPPPRRAR